MAEQTNDKTMKELQNRIELLEKSKTFEATKSEVQKVQMEMLTQLRTIREALVTSGGSGSGGVDAASTKELNSLRDENESLKKQNAKLEYRILHLVRAIEEMEEGKR
mmetsp:Transcript_7703/g.9489  ORF Transcript_7703/g.9489 Transcript_7703/m.9489 type:complete len:107 (-) Transcript_7703:329-649(-)|eukprot:CAMPEP_0172515552 /NCGR_PEP_ID=MMETSP1066-20121228/268833_1 /TAXON_ID=671091 /ORGANISM="Coscinodiscus wailesii, Strain CCMP2513" /LENGTH=106 /DNA_ID=CAMNT_0013296643 /DNA_START=119 /DNA_END=439 /DNA_ORIENTATION=+